MTTQDLVNYYAGLLILQYLGKPKAYATIQTLVTPAILPQVTTQVITFSPAPTAGTFKLNYAGVTTAAINWNDTAATIQTALQLISPAITVTGSIATTLTVTFTGVSPVASATNVVNNTLTSTGAAVSAAVVETDVTLPFAVMNGYNLNGPNPAIGAQLDVLGKYAGVTRTGFGFNGAPITLNDTDFLALIKIAVIQNSAGSSLATIQDLLHMNFPGQIFVFDYQDMMMSYLINSSALSINLIQLFVTEGLLPKPMAVGIGTIIIGPDINFFNFRTYLLPAFNGSPFNNYPDYQLTYPWLSYANALSL